MYTLVWVKKSKSKAITITGCGSLQVCEMLFTIPHCLDNRLTDGDEVVSTAHRPYFTLCQPYAPAALYSPETFIFLFLLLISVRV
jgi:hypothetical protein